MTSAPARRILFIDHAGVLGGAEFSLLDIATAHATGSEVLLLADGPFRRALESRGLRVSVDPLGAFASVRKASRLPSVAAAADVLRVARLVAVRAREFDLIYANSQKAFVVGALASWMSGRPLIWHLRDILAPPHFSGPAARAVVWLANRVAARVIANSAATSAAFSAAGGRASLVRVVHNGIDRAPFDAVSDAVAVACRASLGIAASAPLVVHAGRFHAWKGQQVLLRALALEPRAQALFVGAPLFGEEAFADELKAEAHRLGVATRVQFLGFRDDVPQLMRAATVVVHSSTYPEPFGRVIVEGMLAGRPVIAARAGGVTEIVNDGETGWLVPPNDPGALARAIAAVIDDPAGAASVAARGAAHARANFSRDAMLRGVASIIEAL